MNRLDEQIRQALDQEQKVFFDQYDEQSLPQQMIDSFKGKSRWLMVMAFCMTFAFTILMFYSGYRFFIAEAEKELIAWATGCLLFSMMTAMLKMWTWMELNKHSITREVKRLELQVAYLARKISE